MEELGLIHSILSHKASWLIRGGRQCEALALNAYLTHTLGWWQRKVGYTMCFQLPAGSGGVVPHVTLTRGKTATRGESALNCRLL